MLTFRQLYKSKLLSNICNQFILYGFSGIVPILLIPFLLNVIGVEKYGLINFCLVFSFYFQVFNEFGFDLSNVRHVVNNRENPEKLGRIVSSILQAKIFLVFCSFIVFYFIVISIPSFRKELILYSLAYFRIIGIAIAPYWFFRSMEDLKYITRISIPVKFLCVLPIFFIVQTKGDYYLVMMCYMLETIVSSIVAIIIAKKKYKIKFQIVTIKEIKYYLKDSVPFFSSTFFMRVYTNMNTLILGLFVGDFAVGLYTAAEKLYNAYSSFISPILYQILYPYFTRIKDIKRTTKIVLGICVINIVIVLLLYILSPHIIPIFIKAEASNIISYFNFFLILLAISVPVDMIGFPFLGVLNKIDAVNKTTIFSAIIYFICILFLILFNSIDVNSVILALIIANSTCLFSRLYIINKFKLVQKA